MIGFPYGTASSRVRPGGGRRGQLHGGRRGDRRRAAIAVRVDPATRARAGRPPLPSGRATRRPHGCRLPAPGRLPVGRLAGMPLVTTPAGTSTRDLLDRALAAANVVPLIAVETSQREAIAPLVLGGAGTSFLPRPMADALAAQGAVVA